MAVEGGDSLRSVTDFLGGASATALSVRAALDSLLAATSWPDRLSLLVHDSRLLAPAIADHCRRMGEESLAAFISRAVDVGLDQTGAELDLVARLAAVADAGVADEAALSTVGEGLAAVAGGELLISNFCISCDATVNPKR